MTSSTAPPPCVVVVPVKPPLRGKSRMVGMDDEQRRELAEAFALDTVGAALRTPTAYAVLVVTDDAHLARRMAALGCAVVPDGAGEDLNATLVQASAEVARRWPGAVPVALCADLPALRPEHLDPVLQQARARAADGEAMFVRDRAGEGTTLYAAPVERFAPRFGTGSAAAHAADGAVECPADDVPTVRADVDDLVDLGAALATGVGEHTARACQRRATPGE